uniref:Uncharacterized protein n=1 Tax=Urocitellus parryii TaxID=9999 RepID=A0A8D2IEN4_UROPR
MKFNSYLSPCAKLNSKCIKDPGIKPETLYGTEEKVGPNLHHVGLGLSFLNKTPIVQELKSRINKWRVGASQAGCPTPPTGAREPSGLQLQKPSLYTIKAVFILDNDEPQLLATMFNLDSVMSEHFSVALFTLLPL